MHKKGFITVAAGDERYYKAAANLLKSYLLFHTETSKYNVKKNEKLPFAILADRENKYTALFDDVVILKDPTFSYFDKLHLLNNIPYDETIFIETDCLAYSDLNEYFDVFKDADDFSVIGRALPLDTKDGWFLFEEVKEYKDNISFIPRFHSAVMYMRKGEKCSRMHQICMEISKDYSNYMIGGNYEAIDDKLLALSSAVVGCEPTWQNDKYYICYPQYIVEGRKPKPRMHIQKNSCYLKNNQKTVDTAIICHFGSDFLEKYLYKREVHSINALLKGANPKPYVYLTSIILPFYKMRTVLRLCVINKAIDRLSKNKQLKSLWHKIRR